MTQPPRTDMISELSTQFKTTYPKPKKDLLDMKYHKGHRTQGTVPGGRRPVTRVHKRARRG